MKSAAFIVTLVCCCLMFFVKRETKAAMLVMGAMTLTLVKIPGVPLHNANYLLPAAFLLSEWTHLPQHLRKLRHTPYLWKLLLLVSGSTLLAALTSPYVELKEFLQSELFFKYFALTYAFWTVKDKKSLKSILRISIYCLIMLTIFGVLNYMEESAIFVNAMTEGQTDIVYGDSNMGDVYAASSRFRVQSMFKYAFDYGYICSAILLLHLYARHNGLEKTFPFIIVLVCCLFGIITCECRIVWVSCILSVSCFYIWCFPLNKKALGFILVLIACIFSYSTIEVVEEKVNETTDIFQENPDNGGSSIEMRMAQLAMTWFHIENNKFLGLGQGYWAESMTKGTGNIEGLLGIESVVFQYLLERGIIGFVIWIVFYSWLFHVFWRYRKSQSFQTGLGASILALYVIFALGTGELGSVYPTMLLLGFIIKAIESDKIKINRL